MPDLSAAAEAVMNSPFYEIDTDYKVWQGKSIANTFGHDKIELTPGVTQFSAESWRMRFPQIPPENVYYAWKYNSGDISLKPTEEKRNYALFYVDKLRETHPDIVFPLRILAEEDVPFSGAYTDEEYQEAVIQFIENMKKVANEGDFETFYRFRNPIGRGFALWSYVYADFTKKKFSNEVMYSTFINGFRVYPRWREFFEAENIQFKRKFVAMGRQLKPSTPLGKARKQRLAKWVRCENSMNLCRINNHQSLWYDDKLSAMKAVAQMERPLPRVKDTLHEAAVKKSLIVDAIPLKDTTMYLVSPTALDEPAEEWPQYAKIPGQPPHSSSIPTGEEVEYRYLRESVKAGRKMYERLMDGAGDPEDFPGREMHAVRTSLLAALIFRESAGKPVDRKIPFANLVYRVVLYALIYAAYLMALVIDDDEKDSYIMDAQLSTAYEYCRKDIWYIGPWAKDILTTHMQAACKDILYRMDCEDVEDKAWRTKAAELVKDLQSKWDGTVSEAEISLCTKLIAQAGLTLEDAINLDRWRFGADAVSTPITKEGQSYMSIARDLQKKSYLEETLNA